MNRLAKPRAFGRRRLLAAAVAAVMAVGVVAAYLSSLDQEVAPVNGESSTYRDPTGAWEVSYPDRFTQGTIPGPSESFGVTLDGIWIANFASPRLDEHTGGRPPSELPDDGLVVEVYQVFGGLSFSPQESDSEFPISFEDLKDERGTYRGVWRTDTVLANGEPYTVEVRLGPDATTEDQRAAEEIVSSFRIMPLREGTAVGRHLTFYVLAPPDAYPVGSVTRFEESTLPTSDYKNPDPFYLVHVPEGFYALAWPDDLQGGYKDCDVTYDPADREFSCPNGARWALDGSVIEKAGPTFPNDPLGVLLVRISLDDHVLISPNMFMSDIKLDLSVTNS